ncbi:hypothetical protein D187_001079 [Cystobacter fuscus DSM 2262]|uniref:Uncharacterized protein n=1 Tax=Cystobacter fuscus (strain ATCC 25194 / DSM 2262 / NBRC 100088 / M29) TaxID=1242864 RepID=S9PE06_CYSF2|nr:hypothetical protein D187_001079 [Cystobacter fuscus DSM 2262]
MPVNGLRGSGAPPTRLSSGIVQGCSRIHELRSDVSIGVRLGRSALNTAAEQGTQGECGDQRKF